MSQFNRSMIAGERLPFQIDVSQRSVQEWSPNTIFEINTLVRPTDGNETGYIYQNSSEAQSGVTEPAWNSPVGSVTQDGSLNWFALVPPSSEDTIASVNWIQLNPPDGALVLSGQSFSDVIASGYLGGGTAGQRYIVNVTVNMVSGAIYIAQIVLSVN